MIRKLIPFRQYFGVFDQVNALVTKFFLNKFRNRFVEMILILNFSFIWVTNEKSNLVWLDPSRRVLFYYSF